jgi:hypothetical protein
MTLQLAREFGLPEVEVIRALPAGRTVELDVGRWEELLRGLEALGEVYAAIGRFGGASTGASAPFNSAAGSPRGGSVSCFGGFSTWGEFFLQFGRGISPRRVGQ